MSDTTMAACWKLGLLAAAGGVRGAGGIELGELQMLAAEREQHGVGGHGGEAEQASERGIGAGPAGDGLEIERVAVEAFGAGKIGDDAGEAGDPDHRAGWQQRSQAGSCNQAGGQG